jgi:SRSO17 transposase
MKWDLTTYKEHIPYLTRYLSLLLADMGRSETRVATARYVEGLLLPGRRKFIRPLAERLQVDSQSLHQAIANSAWDDRQVWQQIRSQVIPILEPFDRWVINERAWAKQGAASVGVANQRCGANGKKFRCQVNLEILASDGTYAAPLAGRMYLPPDWTAQPRRKSRVGIPEHAQPATKAALALELLREAERDGLAPKTVMADCSYGNDADFRSALLHAGIEFFLEVDLTANMAWDFQAETPAWNSSLQPHPKSLHKIVQGIAPADWKSCSWMACDGILHRTRIATREVFLDCGLQKPRSNLQRLWLIADWPAGQARPFRCYLGNFPRRPSEVTCLQLSRHRAFVSQYQRRLEEDLDLFCYQGRSWKGFHHHLVLSSAAYLFVLCAELRTVRTFWCDVKEESPIDPVLAKETARFASILLRSGSPARETKTLDLISGVRSIASDSMPLDNWPN